MRIRHPVISTSLLLLSGPVSVLLRGRCLSITIRLLLLLLLWRHGCEGLSAEVGLILGPDICFADLCAAYVVTTID